MRRIALVIALAFAVALAGSALAGPSQAELAKNRIDTASKVYDVVLTRWKAGTTTLDQVVAWSLRWLTAVRETPVKGAKLKAALADHLARMKDLETLVADAVAKGTSPTADRDAMTYFVAEAELWAARGK